MKSHWSSEATNDLPLRLRHCSSNQNRQRSRNHISQVQFSLGLPGNSPCNLECHPRRYRHQSLLRRTHSLRDEERYHHRRNRNKPLLQCALLSGSSRRCPNLNSILIRTLLSSCTNYERRTVRKCLHRDLSNAEGYQHIADDSSKAMCCTSRHRCRGIEQLGLWCLVQRLRMYCVHKHPNYSQANRT